MKCLNEAQELVAEAVVDGKAVALARHFLGARRFPDQQMHFLNIERVE